LAWVSGNDLLYLTTVGAKAGQKRQISLGRFAEGHNAWLVIASLGGAAKNPSWYHNNARSSLRAKSGPRRGSITKAQPRYGSYETKTDRVIPIIRLTRDE
jgi:deazaflavin-dependent oxidoreductase (nitroreductase family)